MLKYLSIPSALPYGATNVIVVEADDVDYAARNVSRCSPEDHQ
jgi:hypothetical protein